MGKRGHSPRWGKQGKPYLSAEVIPALSLKIANMPIISDRLMELRLRSWWSRYYNRPLKDPLLESYTLEELLYEFHDIRDRKEAEAKEAKEIDAKIDEEKIDDTLKWAEEDERLEAELAAQEKAMADLDKARNGTDSEVSDIPEELPEEINDSFGNT